MTDHIESLKDMIQFAVDEKPLDFQDRFHSILQDRIADSINNKKIEIAQNMFSEPDTTEIEEPSDESSEEGTETDTEDTQENGEES
jgi:hypothetical protein